MPPAGIGITHDKRLELHLHWRVMVLFPGAVPFSLTRKASFITIC